MSAKLWQVSEEETEKLKLSYGVLYFALPAQ